MYLIFAGGTFHSFGVSEVSGAESLLGKSETSKEANDFIDREAKRSNFDWYEILCLDTMKVETYFRINEELRLHKIWNADEYMRDRRKPRASLAGSGLNALVSTDLSPDDIGDSSTSGSPDDSDDGDESTGDANGEPAGDAIDEPDTQNDSSSETETLLNFQPDTPPAENSAEAPIRVSDALDESFVQIF